jgi:hypothetical protein
MFDEYTTETITDPRIPGIRVRVVVDSDPQPPEFEAGYPVLRYEQIGRVKLVYGDTGDDLSHALSYYLQRAQYGHVDDPIEMFERYVSFVHGGGVNVIERGGWNGYGYVAYGTRKLAEGWGHTDPEKIAEFARDVDVTEWRAYLDGEVYGIVTEQLATETRTVTNYLGQYVSTDTHEVWVEVDSTWGYYGAEHAVEAAREDHLAHRIIPADAEAVG